MEFETYKVSDLKRLIAEESTQFKAKIGNGVESGNKSESGKAYKDAAKRVKDFDGGGKEGYWKPENTEYKKVDENGTTLDYNPENVDEKFKKRVHAQVKGYTSEAEMNNKEEKAADFSNNEKIYQGLKKAGQERHKKIEDLKKSGLQASKMPDGTFKKEEMYENYKTVYFKKTKFLSEEHMCSRIPDEFKTEGNKFIMKDKVNNTYLMEWKNNRPSILEHTDVNKLNEDLSRIKQLMGYSYKDITTKSNNTITEENTSIEKNLNRFRDLIK